MYYQVELVVPPSTGQAMPARAWLPVSYGVVTRIRVTWPYGVGILGGVRVLWGGVQVWPLSLGQWIPSYVTPWETEEEVFIYHEPWGMWVEAYNVDDTFPHRVCVGITVSRGVMRGVGEMAVTPAVEVPASSGTSGSKREMVTPSVGGAGGAAVGEVRLVPGVGSYSGCSDTWIESPGDGVSSWERVPAYATLVQGVGSYSGCQDTMLVGDESVLRLGGPEVVPLWVTLVQGVSSYSGCQDTVLDDPGRLMEVALLAIYEHRPDIARHYALYWPLPLDPLKVMRNWVGMTTEREIADDPVGYALRRGWIVWS